MTTQDAEFAKKVTRHLDHGTASLKQGTAYRLQLARQQALARLEPSTERMAVPELAMAGARRAPAGGNRGFRLSATLGLGVLVVAAVGIGFHQWQAQQLIRDIAETDTAILTSDLPIDAYLDRGFQNWLKHDGE